MTLKTQRCQLTCVSARFLVELGFVLFPVAPLKMNQGQPKCGLDLMFAAPRRSEMHGLQSMHISTSPSCLRRTHDTGDCLP